MSLAAMGKNVGAYSHFGADNTPATTIAPSRLAGVGRSGFPSRISEIAEDLASLLDVSTVRDVWKSRLGRSA